MNVSLISSVARNALVGAVASKLVDSLLMNKLNHKNEEKKWRRNTKFELFSKLTEDILILDDDNFEEQFIEIKKTCAKIVLLLNDRKFTDTIERYLEILLKYKNQDLSFTSLNSTNKKMLNYLSHNIKN